MDHKVLKNASWIVGCRILQAAMNLVISMISARYLGPSNFGLINYAASLVAFIVPLVQLGLRHTIVQEFIENPSMEGEVLGTSLLMSIITSFLGIVGMVAFVCIVNHGEMDTIIVCTLYSISLIFQMTEMTQYWFQAKLLSCYTAVTSLIAYIIVSGYKIFLLVTGKSIYWFAIANALDYLIISTVLYFIYQKIGTQGITVSFARARKLFAKSKYYIVSDMMVTIFAQTDKIMLKLMMGDEVNGYYSAAVTCAGMTGFVFSAIIDSMRPVVLESQKQSRQKFRSSMTCLFSVILYMGLGQSVLITLAAAPIVRILYGVQFIPTVSIMRIITWYSAFSYMGSARNVWILAQGKQDQLWKINCSGALLNVLGNLCLIPVWGAEGAAVATVLTQFFTNFIMCYLVKNIRPCGRLILDAFDFRYVLKMLPKAKKKEK